MTPTSRNVLAVTMSAAADRYEPAMIAELLRAFVKMQSGVDRARLTALLDAGNIRGVLALLDIETMAGALSPAAAIARQAFAEGAALSPHVELTSAAAHWPEAEAFASKHAAEMIRGISVETKAALRLAVTNSIRDGVPRRELEKTIRSMIGLNTQQTAASLTYRQSLIDGGLSLDKVAAKSARYVAKKIRERANTIARYESMNAMNSARRENDLRLQRAGLLPKDFKKEWIASAAGGKFPACRKCFALNGVKVLLKDKFLYDGRRIAGPPGHPRCRCVSA
jgi:hypothetical protein